MAEENDDNDDDDLFLQNDDDLFLQAKKFILSCTSNVSTMKNTDHVPSSSPREVVLQCCQRLLLLASKLSLSQVHINTF